MKMGRTFAALPYCVFAMLVAAELAAILLLNHGTFVYTLDDAYIHLALAERIWGGTYGINAHEFAAPASSILWPFMLAPFASLPAIAFALVPLVLNAAAAATTLFLLVREVRCAIALETAPQSGLPAAAFAAGLILATNLVPLVFTGMEHSLQQLLAVVIVTGLIEEGRTGRAPATLWLGLLLIPLVRYDSLALAVPALLYLFWRGHIRGTLAIGAALGGALAGFSLVLAAHGLGFLPASVMAKSEVMRANGAPVALLLNLYVNLVANTQGNVLLFGLALVLAAVFDRRRPAAERGLALFLTAAVALQLLFGKFGAYFRYEAYLWTATLITIVHLSRAGLTRVLASGANRAAQVALCGVLGAASLGYLFALASTPLAANNIYDQQYQMHRFLTDYYRGPAAVNDLGWVSFGNSSYVLDLEGLASKEALQARLHEADSDWMRRLCQAHGVGIAMIYDGWFPNRPAEWVHMGTLKFDRIRITPAFAQVEFYATDRSAAATVRSELDAFQKSLPNGTRFRFD
jgi:hypothetical protein